MKTPTALRCAHCGRAFTPARSDAVTCSKSCRQRRWRRTRAKSRATHTVLDGLNPPGIQIAIPSASESRAREDRVAALLWEHHRVPLDAYATVKCQCGRVLPEGESMQQHVARMIVEAAASWL